MTENTREKVVNNSSTGPEPTKLKLSGNQYKKKSLTQYIERANKT